MDPDSGSWRSEDPGGGSGLSVLEKWGSGKWIRIQGAGEVRIRLVDPDSVCWSGDPVNKQIWILESG